MLASYVDAASHATDFTTYAEVTEMWKFSADVDDGFETAFLDACKRHNWNPHAMLSCWNSESSVSPHAMNKSGWASGIFQLMPDTARGIGWMPGDKRWAQIGDLRMNLSNARETISSEERSKRQQQISDMQHALMLPFVALSASEQLGWAERFYSSAGPLRTAAACYVQTFLPALIHHSNEPAFVLCGRHGPFSDAYAGNCAAFDPDGSGFITVADLTARIDRAAVGARWQELSDRVASALRDSETDPKPVITDVDEIAWGTVRGHQRALERCGYACCVDGVWGSQSREACIEFQSDHPPLVCDGIAGPLTEAALRHALSTG